MTDTHRDLAERVASRLGVVSQSSGALHVPAQPVYLSLIGAVAVWFGRQAGLSNAACKELEVAVDEATTNVIRHAFPEEVMGEMTVVCTPLSDGVAVTVADKGRAFNPEHGAAKADEKRRRDPSLGGMGLLLIRKMTDEAHYQWDESFGNQLTLVKRKKGAGDG